MTEQPTAGIVRIDVARQFPITRSTIDFFRQGFDICPHTEKVILSEGFYKKFSSGTFPLKVVSLSLLPSRSGGYKFSDVLDAVDPLGYRLLPHYSLFGLAEIAPVKKQVLLAMSPVIYKGDEYIFILEESRITAELLVLRNYKLLPLEDNILFCKPGN